MFWNFVVATTPIILLCLISSIFRNTIVKWCRPSAPPPSKLPSGSLGIRPFIGETLHFISCAYSDRPESFAETRRRMYGNVFKSHLFGSPTIVSTDAEVSRIILHSDAKTFVPSYPKSLMELMGKSSILVVSGSLQRRMHGLIGSFFRSPEMKARLTADMRRFAARSMASWGEDRPVYIQDEAKSIAFEVLLKALAGLDSGQQMELLKKQFQDFIAGLMSLPVNLPGTQLYRSLQAKKKMVKQIDEIVESKRKYGNGNNNNGSERLRSKDVIDALMKEKVRDEVIADNMIDLMIPGEDSVPLLITLAIHYLSDSPMSLKQLTEENLKQKEKLGDIPFCWDDYLSLPFTQAVITETLRMGNVITGVMRKAMKDVVIKGHLIPKGWCVFAYFRSVHLDDAVYDSPYLFNPWRWQDKEMTSNSNFTPFGGGQRLCPGLDLARLQTCIFLHHFVTQFSWVAEKDTIINFPTVRMKKRMPVWVKRRI